jgi:hypothetical protein
MKMEATALSYTVDMYQTTRGHIPEGSTLNNNLLFFIAFVFMYFCASICQKKETPSVFVW